MHLICVFELLEPAAPKPPVAEYHTQARINADNRSPAVNKYKIPNTSKYTPQFTSPIVSWIQNQVKQVLDLVLSNQWFLDMT